MVVLPTGYGKTNIFTLSPLILDILKPNKKHYVLAIIPLLSLMSDMQLKFTKKGVNVAMLTQTEKMSREEIADIQEGRASVILTSPEIFQDQRKWLTLFSGSPQYKNNISLIAVDEAHVLVEWYVS